MLATLRRWLAKYFHFDRTDIGEPDDLYMTQWVLTFLVTGHCLRLHYTRGADRTLDLHDYPATFRSWLVRGWYTEERPSPVALEHLHLALRTGRSDPFDEDTRRMLTRSFSPRRPDYRSHITRRFHRRRLFSVIRRYAADPHRIDEVSPDGAWTVVFMGPKFRKWGFWTNKGWVESSAYFATHKDRGDSHDDRSHPQ
jgi:hypothetical protein